MESTIVSYLLPAIGFLIVYTLNGIKGEITEVKKTLSSLSTDIRNIDKRVLVLETKEHSNG